MKELIKQVNAIIKKYNLYTLREVALFMIITLIIHYSFRYWANSLHFWPIQDAVMGARDWLAEKFYYQSIWIVDHILGINISVNNETRVMYFDNSGFVGVGVSCSGFKQILQFIVLFLVYPGPWKHKLWYIPLGVLAIYITNLFRIVSLSVVVQTQPEYFDVVHDYIVRPLFYVVIFVFWVVWVEKFYPKRMKK
jgi:exosortase/archaeosortase family protein